MAQGTFGRKLDRSASQAQDIERQEYYPRRLELDLVYVPLTFTIYRLLIRAVPSS